MTDTDHLPECHTSMIPDFYNERWICICSHLRACEQRVYQEQIVGRQHDMVLGYRRGRADALREAREAASTQRSKFKARDWDDAIDAALAAIDTLMEDK